MMPDAAHCKHLPLGLLRLLILALVTAFLSPTDDTYDCRGDDDLEKKGEEILTQDEIRETNTVSGVRSFFAGDDDVC